MDQLHSNTDDTSRKRGKHLTLDQRGAIQILKRQGLSLRAIADAVGCAHATIWYELRRGTPQRTSNRGRIPLYMAKRGQASYNEHRTHCRKPYKLDNDLFEPFMQWLVKQIREKHWSLDVCVGYAKLHQLFPKAAMVCTKTLYNMLWAGKLPITVFEVPRALSRKQHRKWNRKNKRMLGRSIAERPAVVDEHEELGHWEADTVVGKRQGKESVVFTMVERITDHYIAMLNLLVQGFTLHIHTVPGNGRTMSVITVCYVSTFQKANPLRSTLMRKSYLLLTRSTAVQDGYLATIRQRISSIHSWIRYMLAENHYRLGILFNLLLQFTDKFSEE